MRTLKYVEWPGINGGSMTVWYFPDLELGALCMVHQKITQWVNLPIYQVENFITTDWPLKRMTWHLKSCS